MNAQTIDHKEKVKGLFFEFSDKILAYAISVIGDYEQARDVVSEVFLKALKEKKLGEENFNCQAWLFKVASNIMNNYFSRFLKRFLSSPSCDLDAFASPENTPHEITEKNEKFARLTAALRKLGRIEGEIVYLKYYESMSYADISDALKIPEGTVASKLSRALRRLSDELEQHAGK